MQTTKEPDQPTTHSSADRKTSTSGVVSADCAALMLVMFALVLLSEIGTYGSATPFFVESFAVVEFPLGLVASFVGLYALTVSRAQGTRLWSLGGYAIAAVIVIVLVNLMLAGEKLLDGLIATYVFFTDSGTHGL